MILFLGCFSIAIEKLCLAQNPIPKRIIKPNSPEAEKRIKEIEVELRSLESKVLQLKKELNELLPLPDLTADADPKKFGDAEGDIDGKGYYLTKATKFVSYDAFGSTNGPLRNEILARLPQTLRERGVDAVISGVGA